MVRILGWAVTLGLAVAVWGGLRASRAPAAVGFHLMFGFFVALVYLLLHSLPFFLVSGVVGEARRIMATFPSDLAGAGDILDARRRLGRTSLVAVAVGLAMPILGLAELRELVPPHTHGLAAGVAIVVHFLNWRSIRRETARVVSGLGVLHDAIEANERVEDEP